MWPGRYASTLSCRMPRFSCVWTLTYAMDFANKSCDSTALGSTLACRRKKDWRLSSFSLNVSLSVEGGR